jgi:hypothetical protein
MGSVHARGDTFLTFGLKALTETNTSRLATVSNPSWGMDVCLLCLYVVLSCVGKGLCDGLITRPEESYRVSVCEQETLKREAKGPSWIVSACE